MEGTALDGKPK